MFQSFKHYKFPKLNGPTESNRFQSRPKECRSVGDVTFVEPRSFKNSISSQPQHSRKCCCQFFFGKGLVSQIPFFFPIFFQDFFQKVESLKGFSANFHSPQPQVAGKKHCPTFTHRYLAVWLATSMFFTSLFGKEKFNKNSGEVMRKVNSKVHTYIYIYTYI